jgi:hypothetical protein
MARKTEELELDILGAGRSTTPPQVALLTTPPTLAETLYAGRLAQGLHPMPEAGDEAHAVEVAAAPDALAQGMADFGISLDMTPEGLFDIGVQCFSTALYNSLRAGVAFRAAKEALELTSAPLSHSGNAESDTVDSTFKDWISARGIAKERVYECIRLAKAYQSIPAAQRKSYLAMGKFKALKLASIEPEAIAEMAERAPGQMDEFATMTREQMANYIRSLRADKANITGRLNTAESRLSRAKPRLTRYEERTEDIRAECLALHAAIELPLSDLQKLFGETDLDQPEGQLQLEQIWVTAHAAAAKAMDLIEWMREYAPAPMPDRPMAQHFLTLEEAVRWNQDYRTILNQYEVDKALRQGKRDADKPKGPGRPKGSTNKTRD